MAKSASYCGSTSIAAIQTIGALWLMHHITVSVIRAPPQGVSLLRECFTSAVRTPILSEHVFAYLVPASSLIDAIPAVIKT